MMLLWKNGPIPERLLSDKTFAWRVREAVTSEIMSDAPSQGDVDGIFLRYNESSPEERDAMDAAFVWMTGYTLRTLAARTVVGEGGDYTKEIGKWDRPKRGRSP